MPMFSTYLPQPHSSSPLKTEDEEESGIASESASLLPQKAIQGSAVSGSSMAPPPAGTRAVSSSYHLPQAQTPTQAPVNRLNPSLAYLPNSVAYSAPTIQRIAPSNIEATDRALVEELVNENLRLNQEVQSLHAIIAMTPTETMHLNNSNPSILQNTYSSQMIQQHPPMQQQFREPPPAGRVLGTIVQPGQRNMSQSIAPFAVSSPSPTM